MSSVGIFAFYTIRLLIGVVTTCENKNENRGNCPGLVWFLLRRFVAVVLL